MRWQPASPQGPGSPAAGVVVVVAVVPAGSLEGSNSRSNLKSNSKSNWNLNASLGAQGETDLAVAAGKIELEEEGEGRRLGPLPGEVLEVVVVVVLEQLASGCRSLAKDQHCQLLLLLLLLRVVLVLVFPLLMGLVQLMLLP